MYVLIHLFIISNIFLLPTFSHLNRQEHPSRQGQEDGLSRHRRRPRRLRNCRARYRQGARSRHPQGEEEEQGAHAEGPGGHERRAIDCVWADGEDGGEEHGGALSVADGDFG